jgi:hypothetical protein
MTMRRTKTANQRRLRFAIGALVFSMTLALEACDGCSSRTTLPTTGAGGSAGAPDGALLDGSPFGGAGGSDGTTADGISSGGGAGSGGMGGGIAATGGAGGIATGGQGGGSARGGSNGGNTGAASGGGQVTGGRGGGTSPGGAGSGGAIIGGRGGVGAPGGNGGGGIATGGVGPGGAGVVTGGAIGGTGGAGSGGVALGDASDGPADSARPDGAIPLWRQSYEAFSRSAKGYYPLLASVWSDSRGVFLLTYDDMGIPAIWSNLGQGWQTTYTWPEGTYISSGPGRAGLRGFVGGALVPIGVSPCSIQLVDDQGARCSGASRDVADVAIIRADLAYAAYSNRILRFDGSFWTQLGDPLPPPDGPTPFGSVRTYALWADASTILVTTYETGTEGFVYLVSSEGTPVLQTGLPMVGFTSAWGSGSSDIWVGSADGGLYHYDGSSWTLKASMTADGSGIIRIWGVDGDLFMITSTELAHWDGTSLQTIESLGSGLYYKDLWANSAKEVFVTLVSFEDTDHREFQARWFDGSSVRRF